MLTHTLNFEITSVFWLNSVCHDSQSFNSPAVCGLINQIIQSMIINQYTYMYYHDTLICQAHPDCSEFGSMR